MKDVKICVKTQYGEYLSKIYNLYNMHDMAVVNTIRTQTFNSKSMELILDDGSIAVFSEDLLKSAMIVIKEFKSI